MKRILSLFLSFVLVFSMVSGTIIAEASSDEPIELVKTVGIDITDKQLSYANKSGDSKTKIIQVLSEDGSTKTNTEFTQIQRNNMVIVSITSDGISEDNDVVKANRIANPGDSAYQGKFTPGSESLVDGVVYFKGRFKYSGELSSTSMRLHVLESGYLSKSLSNDFGIVLSSGEWYDFEYKFDLESDTPSITITYVNTRTTEAQTGTLEDSGIIAFKASGIWHDFKLGTDGSYMMYDDLRIIHEDGTTKAKITSVGSDGTGVVPHSQNKVKFTLDKNIDGITKDQILVKNKADNSEIAVLSITSDASSDGQWVVEATLGQNLEAWSYYELIISKDCYAGYKEVSGTDFVPVTDLTEDFSTPSAPLDIRTPIFNNDGSATTDLVSTNGNTDMTFVYTNIASDGYIKEVKTQDFSVDGELNDVSISFDNGFEPGDIAKLFVIKGWADPVALFTKTWAQSYEGSIPEADEALITSDAAANTIVLKKYDYNTKFDHENNKIVVNLNTGIDAAVSGILYVYEGSLNSSTLVYADYITTAANGTLLKEIKFDPSIASATKEYKVAFYSNDIVEAIEDSFKVYKAADYKNYKRQIIYSNAVNTSTFSGLKQVITGTDDLGNVVNDAWTIFASDVNTADYEALKDKEAVFVNLSAMLKSLANYDALCSAFETISLEQKNKENAPAATKPSSNNKKPGSSSVSMSATPSKPADNGQAVGGSSVAFTDMTNHWAQKHAEALVEKGIVNGYADGSFRGDNPITRAELTKIIVEALNVPEKEGINFADVAQSSWYNSYVSRAATAGVVNGFEDGSFKPEANVSRQDAVLMIYRAMNLTAQLPEGFKYFADENDIQDYSSEAIRCLGDLGIITGDNAHFRPLNNITRAEMAAVICRAIDYMESHLQ